jgi:DNA-directed RNA polymerase beta' subunit
VKQITRPYVFDSLDQVVPGGLYDKALGPHDKFDNCVTCTLPYKECLGHMGHIELSVPVCYSSHFLFCDAFIDK